jgi:sec-independent protein translocase protein TatA
VSGPEFKTMGIGFRELLIILAIALLIFGAKKLRTIGTDLGAAVKGFKKAMNDGENEETTKQITGDKQPDADFNTKESQKNETGSSKNA